MKIIYNVPIFNYEGFSMSVEAADESGQLKRADACPECKRGDGDPISEPMTTRTLLRTVFNAFPRTESKREDDTAITSIMSAILEADPDAVEIPIADPHYLWLFGDEEAKGFLHREVKNPVYDADTPGSSKAIDFGRLIFGVNLTGFKDQMRKPPKGHTPPIASIDGAGQLTEFKPVD